MAKNEIAIIEKKTLPTVEAINSLEIKTEKDQGKAADWLSDLKAALKQVETYRKAKTDPINEALSIIRAETSPIEKKLKAAIEEVGEKMTDYQTEQTAIADSKKEKIADRVGPGRGKLSLDTAANQIDQIEVPKAALATDKGAVKFRATPQVDITPLNTPDVRNALYNNYTVTEILKLIEAGFIVWDEVAIRKAILAAKESKLPGVTYKIVQKPVNL